MNVHPSTRIAGRRVRRARLWLAPLASLAWLHHPPALAAQAIPASGSPAITALREAIQANHPQLTARRAAVEAAEARVRAAGASSPATLSAEAEEIPGGIDLGAASLRVGIEREFLSGGRRAGARAVAGADVSAARAAVDATARRLDAQALRALTQVAGWKAIYQRLGAEDSLLVSAEEALRARFGVGEARYVDVLRLRTERLRVQNEQAEALTALHLGRVALDLLLTNAPSRYLLIDEAVAEAGAGLGTVQLPSPPLMDSLVANSAALRMADAEVERSRASRMLLLAEQRPRITAGLGVQRFPSGSSTTLGPTLSGSITLPFTAWRGNQAAALAAERDVATAVAERDAAGAAVLTALYSARERYDAARTRLAVFDAALLRGAREEREAALASFRSGDLSLIELLDFERALARAETERLQSVLDAYDALAALYAGGAESSESPTRSEAGHD